MVMRWPAPLGLPGALAAAVLTLALWLAAGLAPHWQQEAQAERRRHAELPRTTPSAVPSAPGMPDVGEPADRVADLLALAVRHGVRVERTQQRVDMAGPVQRLHLGLSAKGRYEDLRAFLAASLVGDAGLALDAVRLHRALPNTAELDADIEWTLLRRTAGSGP